MFTRSSLSCFLLRTELTDVLNHSHPLCVLIPHWFSFLLILLYPNPSSVSTQWVILISDNNNQGILSSFKYKLEFIVSPTFNTFASELQNVNILIGLEQFQPVKFKLRNKDDSIFNIFTGAVEGSSESHATFESDVEDKISLTMKGGIYDKTNQVIFFNID